MNNKLMSVSAIVLALSLGGCANNDAMEQNVADLNTKIDSLNSKVESLSGEVGQLKVAQEQSSADAQAAKEMATTAAADAAQANEKADNLVSSYKK
jgi:murein lipoprotein